MRGLDGRVLIVIYLSLAALPLALAYGQGLKFRPLRDEISSAMAIVVAFTPTMHGSGRTTSPGVIR